jgi:hypothetical protein
MGSTVSSRRRSRISNLRLSRSKILRPPQVLIKEKNASWIKNNAAGVTKFIEDLAKIDFPRVKEVSEGIAHQVGPALLSNPLFATIDKVALLLPGTEESPVIEDTHATRRKKKKPKR